MNPVRKFVATGAIAGLTLAGGAIGASMLGTANAATGTTSSTSSEVHSGHGGALDLGGTVTAVGSSSVTIKTSSGTTTYSVTSSSDIDKDGEATLKDLTVGDAVTFSVGSTDAKQIDKLHAGDMAKDMPTAPSSATSPSSSSGA